MDVVQIDKEGVDLYRFQMDSYECHNSPLDEERMEKTHNRSLSNLGI